MFQNKQANYNKQTKMKNCTWVQNNMTMSKFDRWLLLIKISASANPQ